MTRWEPEEEAFDSFTQLRMSVKPFKRCFLFFFAFFSGAVAIIKVFTLPLAFCYDIIECTDSSSEDSAGLLPYLSSVVDV